MGLLGPVVEWVEGKLRGAGVLPSLSPSYSDDENEEEEKPQHIRILIHCAQGISRSPAVGAALLVALPLVDSDSASDSASESASEFSEAVDADTTQDEDTDMEEEEREEEVDEREEEMDTEEVPRTPARVRAHADWTSPARHCASPASLSFSPLRLPLRPPTSSLHTSSLPSIPPSPESPAARSVHPHASLPSIPSSSSTSGSNDPTHSPARRTLSAPAALAYVAARRPAADVNWGFRAQLNEWEGVCRDRAGTGSEV